MKYFQPKASPRGFRHPGGGYASYLTIPQKWRTTTNQACGLWTFGTSATAPLVGVPLGRDLLSHQTVCADPIAWFRANIISNPSMFVLGNPGLGKSTMVRRILLGNIARGFVPLVLGDLKPDYVDLVEAVGGQVIKIGRGVGGINPLDPGGLKDAVLRLRKEGRTRQADQLMAELQGRQVTITAALIELSRRQRLRDHELAAMSQAMVVLNENDGKPTLNDLVKVLESRHPLVREAVFDRGSDAEYQRLTDDLQRSLTALLGGSYGALFAGQTSVPLDLDAPAVCIDTSGISDTDETLQAAVLLAAWSDGFGSIVASQALSDAGLRPQRIYLAVMDELWRVLRAGEGLVDRIDALTRLNRQIGMGLIMITHTVKDLEALRSVEDRMKAKGFIERAGMIAVMGTPNAEMDLLRSVVNLSKAEADMVTSWSSPPAWDPHRGASAHPPGMGCVLMKVGSRPGIAFRTQLTASELSINDTNKKWT